MGNFNQNIANPSKSIASHNKPMSLTPLPIVPDVTPAVGHKGPVQMLARLHTPSLAGMFRLLIAAGYKVPASQSNRVC